MFAVEEGGRGGEILVGFLAGLMGLDAYFVYNCWRKKRDGERILSLAFSRKWCAELYSEHKAKIDQEFVKGGRLFVFRFPGAEELENWLSRRTSCEGVGLISYHWNELDGISEDVKRMEIITEAMKDEHTFVICLAYEDVLLAPVPMRSEH